MKRLIFVLIAAFFLFSGCAGRMVGGVYPQVPPAPSARVSNTPYDATSWNGVDTVAPSKNAVRDKLESISGTVVSQEDCSGITSGACIDTDDGIVYYYDGDTVEILGEVTFGQLAAANTWANTQDFTGATVLLPAITLGDNGYVGFDATADGMDDDEYNGEVIRGRNCGENLAQWDLVRLANDADPWHQATADAVGEYPAIGLSIAACTDTNEATILVKGVVRNEGWAGLTPGGAVYLDDSDVAAGRIIQTAPSDSNDCVQIVGWALSDSEIYFDFSRPYQLVE